MILPLRLHQLLLLQSAEHTTKLTGILGGMRRSYYTRNNTPGRIILIGYARVNRGNSRAENKRTGNISTLLGFNLMLCHHAPARTQAGHATVYQQPTIGLGIDTQQVCKPADDTSSFTPQKSQDARRVTWIWPHIL